jgi:hypothetical protein
MHDTATKFMVRDIAENQGQSDGFDAQRRQQIVSLKTPFYIISDSLGD